MTEEKRNQIKALRQQMANLSAEEKQVLSARGLIATVEGRVLSLHNTIMVYLQSNGHTPTVVGGYQQWRKAGRQVQKGQHGMTIWFPRGEKDSETGDIVEIATYYTATVFDISQTEVRE